MTGPADGPADGSAGGPETFADDARRYRLVSRIATGGMGEVWRATDTVLGRRVAVKLLKSEYADDAAFRSRFETEARHAGALQHPGIAAVFDFGEATATDGSGQLRPYLVMELVDGQPLSALLRPGEAMEPEVARDLIAQAADAIGAAHALGIVHRDLKPANLLVTPARQVKITDFGIARAADGLALTQTGQVMGTPQYLSPEQARGQGTSPASDVYSLGVVAFECLAGRRPFSADSPVATALAHLREPVPPLPDDVPGDLAAVVRTALAKEPQQRYPDGTAFAAALRDPATAATAVVPPPVGEGSDSTQVLPGAGAAAGAVGAAGLAGVAAGATGAGPSLTPSPTPASTPAHADGRKRRRGAWWLLAGALALLVVLVVAFLVLGNEGDTTDPTEQPTGQPGKHRDRGTGPTSEPTTAPTSQATQEPTQQSSSAAPTDSSSNATTPSEESSSSGSSSSSAPTDATSSASTPTDTATDTDTPTDTATKGTVTDSTNPSETDTTGPTQKQTRGPEAGPGVSDTSAPRKVTR